MAKKPPIIIPKYSLSEELISAISHGVGSFLSIAALVIALIAAVKNGSIIAIVSAAVYGSTLILLYTMSTLYHSLKVNKAKRVFRVIDHCCIFLLIAGTYTPFTLITLQGSVGWLLFGIVWGAAVLGIILNAVDLKKYAIASVICYLVMGWVIVFAFGPLKEALHPRGLLLLISGGIAYSVGAGLYAIGSKIKYFHSVFHFFVLIGSALHFFAIILYVL